MHTSRGFTLDETMTFIKKGGAVADKNVAHQHQENLLYMKSVLYLDDKQNEKHLHRIQVVLDAVKKEYSKELSEVAPADGAIYLAAQILTANKIVDVGIARLNAMMEKGAAASSGQAVQKAAATVATATTNSSGKNAAALPRVEHAEGTEAPKLRETLGFLVSVIGDPLRDTSKIALHLPNLEKISSLTKRTYQDPKVQKMNENILGVLAKIFGVHNQKEINKTLDNCIKILKDLTNYKTVVATFENDMKNFLVQASSEHAGEAPTHSRRANVDKFYAQFHDEKNAVKRINMAKTVLTSQAYKFDRELNAASLKFLKNLETVMGLEVDSASLNPEKEAVLRR